jgi:hypothetical protein
MGRASVAVLDSRAQPLPADRRPNIEAGVQLKSLRRQLGYGRRLRPRRTLGLVALLVVGTWVILSFGRTITSLNDATARQAVLLSETSALTAQLQAGHRELDLVQTDSFQALQARAYGIGAPGEIAFSLESDAPAPLPITPLGAAGQQAQPQTPLDAWLRLLFGD